jgi:6-methylsalicylate decarboxylase
MEFFFDTTRTVTNMLLKGTFKRFPDIKFVIPHAGAFLSILVDRLAPVMQMMPVAGSSPNFYTALKELYFDLAGFCLPRQMAALLQLVDASHLFYGSDYPYTPQLAGASLAGQLDKTNLLTDEQRQAVYFNNAVKLFPRLQKAV